MFDKNEEIDKINEKIQDLSDKKVSEWIEDLFMGNIVSAVIPEVEMIDQTMVDHVVTLMRDRIMKALAATAFDSIVGGSIEGKTQQNLWQTMANKLGIKNFYEFEIDPAKGYLNFVGFARLIRQHYPEKLDQFYASINAQYDCDWITREVNNGLTDTEDYLAGSEAIVKKYNSVSGFANKWLNYINKAASIKTDGADLRRSYLALSLLQGDLTEEEKSKIKNTVAMALVGSGAFDANVYSDMEKNPTKYLNAATNDNIIGIFDEVFEVREMELFYRELLCDVMNEAGKEFIGLFDF